jgi:hypothetical protein
MRRLGFIAWCIGSVALWIALVVASCRFVLSRVWYEIPVGFYQATNNALLWVVRWVKPAYDPGVLQMADAGQALLLGLACLICAVIVARISAYGWRRFNSRRVRN